ncbi:hypothetical protein Tco_0007695 [Tanacetum coccineum]
MKKDEREWKGKVLTIGFLYLEMEVVCVEFGCHFEVEIEYEFTLSSLEVLQRFSFFLQMGFTFILSTFDGLYVGLLEDVIGEDNCDDDDCDEEMSLVRMEWLPGDTSCEDDKVDDSRLIVVRMSRFFISLW